jgi:putative membrane protein
VLLARRDAVRRVTGPGFHPGPPPGAHRDAEVGEGVEVEDAEVGEFAGFGDDLRPGGVASWEPPDHDLARLHLGMLLGSMLLAPETVALVLGGVALAVAGLFVDGLLVAPGLPVMIGIVLVQGRKLSAYYGFTVSQTRAGLQVRRGLFERSTQTIALARVQGVVVSEPVMWRPLGWARLDVSLAGYGSGSESDGSPSATTVMPVAPRPVVMALAADLLHGRDPALEAGADPDAVPLVAPPRSSRWLDPFARRFQASGLGDQLAVARAGWFTRRTHVVRHARVQSVRLVQGPVQRRLGLADVHLDSPPGPVHVLLRNRASVEARRLAEQERTLSRQARRAS